MSSQDNKGIPLQHGPTGVGYKLLELPPEVLALLESDNPPVLTLESSATAGLLKTPDGKAYSLRQKNTSNALILLSPSSGEPSSLSQIPEGGLSTVATVHETVELVPVPETAGDAAPAPAAKGKWHERFGRSR